MPIARFGMPDGRVARFEVPEGTTPEQAQSMMTAHFSENQQGTAAPPQQQPKETSLLQDIGQGAGNLLAGGVRGAGSIGATILAPYDMAKDALAAADLFTFLPIYEPSANAVAEALAAGLPVITSSQNGACELIREGINGSVVSNPADRVAVFSAVSFWLDVKAHRPVVSLVDVSLERNVSETLAVLELAARERNE